MPATYSINVNTTTESFRLATIEDVLFQMPDNLSMIVTPHFIRDAFYSTWESAIFKQITGSASIEYIGIDNPSSTSGSSIYTSTASNIIYFGKKKLLGNNTYGNDVMTSSLLTYGLSQSNTDIYFFNNKVDFNPSQQNTKISILSGTDSTQYGISPYIESIVVNGYTSSYLDLGIGNNSGNLNIYGSSSRVYINNIGLPTISETSASASTGAIMTLNSGILSWHLNLFTASNLGTSSQSIDILGATVSINGYDIQFSDHRNIINQVGGISKGMSFSNQSIVNVVKQMLYSYIPPTVSVSVNPSIGEKGNIGTPIQVGWTIYKGTDNITYAAFSSGNVVGFSSPAPITIPGTGIFSSPPYVLGLQPFTFSTSYTFVVSDGVTTSTASTSFKLVYPYFWGVDSIDITNPSIANSVLGSLTKTVTSQSDKIVPLSGTGYVYFIYPVNSGGATYGTLSSILDQNSVTQSYTYSIYSNPGLTSPNYYWSNISYYVYQVGPVTIPSSVSWSFNY
jgi:hypothetical protein